MKKRFASSGNTTPFDWMMDEAKKIVDQNSAGMPRVENATALLSQVQRYADDSRRFQPLGADTQQYARF